MVRFNVLGIFVHNILFIVKEVRQILVVNNMWTEEKKRFRKVYLTFMLINLLYLC